MRYRAWEGGWSRNFDRCRRCKGTDRPHVADGLCEGCYRSGARRDHRPEGSLVTLKGVGGLFRLAAGPYELEGEKVVDLEGSHLYWHRGVPVESVQDYPGGPQ